MIMINDVIYTYKHTPTHTNTVYTLKYAIYIDWEASRDHGLDGEEVGNGRGGAPEQNPRVVNSDLRIPFSFECFCQLGRTWAKNWCEANTSCFKCILSLLHGFSNDWPLSGFWAGVAGVIQAWHVRHARLTRLSDRAKPMFSQKAAVC